MRLRWLWIVLALLVVGQVHAQGGAPVSDDFNAYRLDSDWAFINPIGTAQMRLSGTNTIDAWLQIDIPRGEPQDAWYTGNNAPRIMQTVRNGDFTIETRFESSVSRNGQSQGFMVEQDQGNFLQVFFTSENNETVLIAAAMSSYQLNLNDPYVRVTVGSAGTAPLWLRLSRATNEWIASYSIDGVNWTDTPAFTQRISATQVGLYAGSNSFFGDAPAFTMIADYFVNTASPIADEDGGVVDDLFEPQVLSLDPLPYDNRIVLRWLTDEPAMTTVEYGTTSNFELGVITTSDFQVNHSLELPDLQPSTTYNVRITSGDALGNEASGEPFTVTTLAVPPSTPAIQLWYGDTQSFGLLGIPQRFVNILGRVIDTDEGDEVTMTYSVNGSEDIPLSVGPDRRRLSGKGDFNIEVPIEGMIDGENEILIRARDRYDNRSNVVVSVFYSDSSLWSIPYSVDWAGVQNLQAAVQVVDGWWEVENDGLRTREPGWRRMVMLGDLSWQDYEVLVRVTVHEIIPPSSDNANVVDPEPFVGVMPRWTGYYNWDDSQPAVGNVPVGSLGRYMWRTAVQANNVADGLELLDGGLAPVAQDQSQLPLFENADYYIRMRAFTSVDGGAFYAMRLWRADTEEPTWWNIATSVQAGGTTAGSIALVAHRVDVTFGDIEVTSLTPDAYLLPTYDNRPPECTIVVLGTGANLRAGAGANFAVARSVTGGSELVVNGQITGDDGVLWYRAAEDLSWLRSDLASANPDCEGVVSLDPPSGS